MATRPLSFFKILELGLRIKVKKGNTMLSNCSLIDEAFQVGVLDYKRRLRRRAELKGGIHVSLLPEILRKAFPYAPQRTDAKTQSMEVPLLSGVKTPQRYICSEVHFFLDNSTESFQALARTVERAVALLKIDTYTALEIVSDHDARLASAVLGIYNPQNQDGAEGVAQAVEQFMDPVQLGHRVDLLYPESPYEFSSVFAPGEFGRRKQDLFMELWTYLRRNEVLFLEDWLQRYDQLKPVLHLK